MNRIREEIDRELSSVTFESIDKERLERKLSYMTRKDKHMKLNKKLITGVAAAVAGVTVLTVSVGAATGWNYGRLVSEFFGREDIGQSEADAINKLDSVMQQIPDGSVTNTFTNYDASFDGIICDGKALMVSATLKSKDGTPFDENNYYSGFFRVEGTRTHGGYEGVRVMDDGTLQAVCCYQVDITEKTNMNISYNYLLCNSDELKFQDVSELNPEEVLDPGVLSTEIEVDVCRDYKEFELTNADGNVINAHITPISIEFTYDPSIFANGTEKVPLDISGNDGKDNGNDNNEEVVEYYEIPSFDRIYPTDIVIYDKDGNELVASDEYRGGTSDDEGLETGIAYYRATFAKVIDVDDIGGIVCKDYTFGEVPTK